MLQCVKCLGVIAASLFSVSQARAEDAILLQYKMTVGEEPIYRSTVEMIQTQTVNKLKVESKIENVDISVITLLGTDSSKNLRLQTENKQLNVKIKIADLGDYLYDSKKDENEKESTLGAVFTPIYDTLKGAVIKVTISPTGKIIELRGYASLLSSVLKDNPLGRQFTGGGSDKAKQYDLAEFYPVFSKKPVKPGDSWEETYKIAMPKLGTFSGKRLYKFVGFDRVGKRKTAKITFTTELTFKVNLKQSGTNVTGKLTIQKSSGTVQFDPVKGKVVSIKSEYTITGNLQANVNGTRFDIDTKQVQKISLELLDKLPE
ncbi:MAG: hypothetical protein IID45_06470 [Planctomycetes bacterium]|nr:hypothetical protein [Planctomycetota bacterium]